MSWSIQVIGTSDAIVRAIEKESANLTGQSKTEFDEAKPHLIALVEANLNGGYPLELGASGHAAFDTNGVKTFANCHVEIKQLGRKLVQ